MMKTYDIVIMVVDRQDLQQLLQHESGAESIPDP